MSAYMKVSSNPHIRSTMTTQKIMFSVIVALLPAAGFGIYNFGFRALLIILLSVLRCELSEMIFNKICNKASTMSDLSAVVTGLLLALNLPVSVPWWIPVIGGAFAIVVVKMLFGGLGQGNSNKNALRQFGIPWGFSNSGGWCHRGVSPG